MDSPRKSLLSRASASVLGGISKAANYLNPITSKIDDAKDILNDRKERLLNEPYEMNAKNLRLSRSGNKFTGPMTGRTIDEASQKRIHDVYKRAIEILDSRKRVKFMALHMTKAPADIPKYLADYAVTEAYAETPLHGGKKKGKSRKSSKTRKNRKTRSRK
jgi:hypothetical protein